MNSKGNRGTAVFELTKRKRVASESPETHAYKMPELVKYAYRTFEQTTRDTIAKDYFIQGLANKSVTGRIRVSWGRQELRKT